MHTNFERFLKVETRRKESERINQNFGLEPLESVLSDWLEPFI